MAHSISAKKRIRQNTKKRAINRARKSMVKTQIKNFEQTLAQGDVEKAQSQFNQLVKKIDKVAATSTLHKNTAARTKSRLARKLNQLTAKQA